MGGGSSQQVTIPPKQVTDPPELELPPIERYHGPYFGSAANAEGYMAARAANEAHTNIQERKKIRIQNYISWYGLQIAKLRPTYKMLGRDIIHGRANGKSYFGKCFVKYISDTNGQYMGVLTNKSHIYQSGRNVYNVPTFNNEYTGTETDTETTTTSFYIFVPCKQMLLDKIKHDNIHIGTEIDNIYELVVQRWFLVGLLEETKKDTIKRGGYRKSNQKKHQTRRKSIRKLKKDG